MTPERRAELERRVLGKAATKPGESEPDADAPRTAAGSTDMPPDFGPLGMLRRAWKAGGETVDDYARAAVDKVTGGLGQAAGAKLQELTGSTQPTPYEESAAAEKRSPIATGAGQLSGDLALFALTRGMLGKAGVTSSLAKNLGASVLPTGAEAFIKTQLGEPTEGLGTEAALRGGTALAAQAAPALASIPSTVANVGVNAVASALPVPLRAPVRSAGRSLTHNLLGGRIAGALGKESVKTGLTSVGPGLLDALLTTSGPERAEADERERRRRAARNRASDERK